MGGHGFPAQPGELDAGWLTEQLRASGAIGPEHEVSGWDATPVGEGVGMLGVICRLELRYAGEAGPLRSLVAKFATPTEANRAVAQGFRLYEREVRFYRDLAGSLSEGLPACYGAEVDVESGDFVLLLEDLAGYRDGDQAAGCDRRVAELGIDVMAGLHAAWWGARERPELAWVPTVDGELHATGMMAGYQAGIGPTLDGFGHLVAPELRDAADRFGAALPWLHQQMGSAPQTLAHGDFRLDNLMFGTQPGQHPLVLLDWQGLIVSRGVHDVAYLLAQNVVTEERRASERDLLARYSRRLEEGGVTGYSAEACWEDYRIAALWMWEYAVVIAGTLDPSNERGRAFMSGMVERQSHTIMDLGLLDLLPA